MQKKYILLLLMAFFSVTASFSQPSKEKQLTKKERKALKKAKKLKKDTTVNQELVIKTKNEEMSEAQKSDDAVVVKNTQIQAELPKKAQQTQPVELILETLTQNSQEFIEPKTNGNINWTQQYIEAVGQAVIDNDRFKNPAQAKLMASRGAVVVAQRNLLEIVKGVSIVGETTVQDMMTTSDYVYTRVEGTIKGAQPVGEAKEKDGFMEIRLRMPIYGNGSLANTIDEPSLANAKKINGFEMSNNFKQKENTEDGIDGSKPILFNIEGEGTYDPSMFPVIVDENGKVLFDFSKIYNPNKGSFPQYLQLTKDILQAYGNDKGVDLINMVQTGRGQFKIPEKSSKNVFWNKVARVAQDVGSVLFKLIL